MADRPLLHAVLDHHLLDLQGVLFLAHSVAVYGYFGERAEQRFDPAHTGPFADVMADAVRECVDEHGAVFVASCRSVSLPGICTSLRNHFMSPVVHGIALGQ